MTIDLPADIAEYLHEQVATGQYASPEDVLRDAVKSLRRHRVEVAAIQEGLDDMAAGRYRPIEDADAAIRRRHGLPLV